MSTAEEKAQRQAALLALAVLGFTKERDGLRAEINAARAREADVHRRMTDVIIERDLYRSRLVKQEQTFIHASNLHRAEAENARLGAEVVRLGMALCRHGEALEFACDYIDLFDAPMARRIRAISEGEKP